MPSRTASGTDPSAAISNASASVLLSSPTRICDRAVRVATRKSRVVSKQAPPISGARKGSTWRASQTSSMTSKQRSPDSFAASCCAASLGVAAAGLSPVKAKWMRLQLGEQVGLRTQRCPKDAASEEVANLLGAAQQSGEDRFTASGSPAQGHGSGATGWVDRQQCILYLRQQVGPFDQVIGERRNHERHTGRETGTAKTAGEAVPIALEIKDRHTAQPAWKRDTTPGHRGDRLALLAGATDLIAKLDEFATSGVSRTTTCSIGSGMTAGVEPELSRGSSHERMPACRRRSPSSRPAVSPSLAQ